LDVIAFLGSLVTDGLDQAISERAQSLKDLVWQQTGTRFELAVQTKIPENFRHIIYSPDYTDIRYEVAIGEHENEYEILEERVLFLQPQNNSQPIQKLFPALPDPVDTILTQTGRKGVKVIVIKRPGGTDNYYSEKMRDAGKSWAPSFRLGPRKSAFGNLVDDVERFPVSAWFRDYLSTGIQSFMLNSKKLREMSAPGQGKGFSTDGSNLPWVIEDLKKNHPDQFKRWVAHLQSALPDIEEISTEVRPDTLYRYLKIRYRGGLEVPSWMVSDGTLRMLALTLPAYLPDYSGVFLIEEPENGIHPRAVETVYQSLSSVYNAQVMLATHSPIILNMAGLRDILCFAKASDGSTDIVAGNEHPLLQEWQSKVELGTLLASGVLG